MKIKRYGTPYKGSKSRIVEKLGMTIPFEGVENFYDLFAGGAAVTHYMLLNNRYEHIYANDYDGSALRMFNDAIHGKYRDEKRWISREDFIRLKDTDPYVQCCWSFGNNQRDYLYSRKIEPYKKACHYVIVFGDFSLLRELCPEVAGVCEEALRGVTDTHERRVKFGPTIVSWLKAHGTLEMVNSNPLYSSCHVKKDTKTRPKGTIRDLERLQSLERLERLESLQSLQSLERLERLEISTSDYRLVEIKPNSVIYCDPPYSETNTYSKKSSTRQPFNHAEFYDWCCEQEELVLVSEYNMPADRFTEVWSTSHVQSLCATKTSEVTERLFVPTRQLGKYREMMGLAKQVDINKPRYVEMELFPQMAFSK